MSGGIQKKSTHVFIKNNITIAQENCGILYVIYSLRIKSDKELNQE